MNLFSSGKRNGLSSGRIRVICTWFSLFLFLTPPIWVFANGDHSDEHPHAQQAFNPIAFALVSGGIVVVGYFLYRIFSGSGKKNTDTEKEG